MTYASRPMGDYKTGGYAGDPGFLSSLWKGFKKVAKFIPGPIGTVARVAALAGVGIGAAKIMTPPTFPGGTSVAPAFGYPDLIGRGGAPNMLGGPWMTAGQGRAKRLALGGPEYAGTATACAPTGYHLAKDGSGRFVRNRRMNVANPRALRKAMRRVQGFEKLARRTIQFTRRVKMKKRKAS